MDHATRERWALHYALALETGDLDALGSALAAAEGDRLLGDVLSEIDRQYADDHAGTEATIHQMAPAHPDPTDSSPEVPTVGEVASRLAHIWAGLYLDVLHESTAPLPSSLSAQNVGRLLTEIVGEPPTVQFRSAFRSEALDAIMQFEAQERETADCPMAMAARTPKKPTS